MMSTTRYFQHATLIAGFHTGMALLWSTCRRMEHNRRWLETMGHVVHITGQTPTAIETLRAWGQNRCLLSVSSSVGAQLWDAVLSCQKALNVWQGNPNPNPNPKKQVLQIGKCVSRNMRPHRHMCWYGGAHFSSPVLIGWF